MLLAFNLIIATIPSSKLPEYIANICGSTTVPFLQFVLPGSLYYYYQKKYGVSLQDESYSGKSFKEILKRFIFGKTFAQVFSLLGMI